MQKPENCSACSVVDTFMMSILNEADFISNWTCVICKLRPGLNYCVELNSQFVENEESVLYGIDYVIYIKCCICGSLYHAHCLQINVRDIYLILNEYICPSCA